MNGLIRKIIGIVCIVGGVVWSVMFPKTGAWLRPDFVASAALGLGLILPGVILFLIPRVKGAVAVLAILLIESILLNGFLFSWAREATRFIQQMVEQPSAK